MSSTRPSQLFPEFARVEGIDDAYERNYPFESVALAVARLRGSLGLTQAEFGRRIGAPQSVVARLESGRHGIQVSLLNRIAEAFGGTWQPEFSGILADEEPVAPVATVEASGDDLLDAFNKANTAGDFEQAHGVAKRIAKAATTPRRQVALALDAFNRGDLKAARRWAQKALASDPPGRSAQVASLVAGRSMLGLGQAQDALHILEGAGDSWLAGAARAEATLDAGDSQAALALAERLLAQADDSTRAPAAYLAARTYWHANRPFEALSQIGAFRLLDPDDVTGRLLNGAILGYIGDTYEDREAHEAALAIFEGERDAGSPESLRLYAMTAARVGRWRAALEATREMVDRSDQPDARKQAIAQAIAEQCFERLDDPDELLGAADLASELALASDEVVRSQRALAKALRGDFDGAVSALDLEPDQLERADPKDQIRCAVAYISGSRYAEAFPILRRCEADLSNPDGHLFLARAALARLETTAAREALGRITDGDGPTAETARVAIEVISSIESAGHAEILQNLRMVKEENPTRVLFLESLPTAPNSPWEGPAGRDGAPEHDSGSPVLDYFTKIGLATWSVPGAITH